jgi:transcriptional regulator with XRE-family HTH domain
MAEKKIEDLLRIGYFMKLNNISREEMAESLNVSLATITNIANDKTYPSIHVLVDCAEIFDIDIKELFISTKISKVDDILEAKELIKSGLEILERHIM